MKTRKEKKRGVKSRKRQADKTRDDRRLCRHVPVGTTDRTAKILRGRHVKWEVDNWGSPARLDKMQLNVKTLARMHRTNCTEASMVQQNQQQPFLGTVHCSPIFMAHQCASSFIPHLTFITLLQSKGSQVIHWGEVSKTPFITSSYCFVWGGVLDYFGHHQYDSGYFWEVTSMAVCYLLLFTCLLWAHYKHEILLFIAA